MATAAPSAVAITGLRELSIAFQNAGKDARVELRVAMQSVAKPVRQQAAVLAMQTIRNAHKSPEWAVMRTGVTRVSVYVAPKKRGIKTRGPHPHKRPNFANLLMDKAMSPALEANRIEIERRAEQMLDKLGRDWATKPPNPRTGPL